jgi:hypothetical protein
MKPAEAFSLHSKGGRQSWCKECNKEYQRIRASNLKQKQQQEAQQRMYQWGAASQTSTSEPEPEQQAEPVYPLAQRTIDFYGDDLTAVQVGEQVYSPVKYMCECLGVAWAPQWQRIERDAVLSTVIVTIIVEAKDGKQREAICLPAEYINGWLFGIDENRVKPELREKLIAYKREAYVVLAKAFMGEQAGTAMSSPAQYTLPMWVENEGTFRTIVQEEAHQACTQAMNNLSSITKTEYLDRPVDGRVYIAIADDREVRTSANVDIMRLFGKGWKYVYISQSARNPEERIKEYLKKRVAGTPPPVIAKVIASDNRRRLEAVLQKERPEGTWKVPGRKDEFMVSPEVYKRLIELPDYIPSVDIVRLRGWLLCQTMFYS